MQWFKEVDGGNPDGTAKDRVGLTAGTTYLAKYWNDNFFNIFNFVIGQGYSLIDNNLEQFVKASRGKYNPLYTYNTSVIATQTVNDIVLGSDGIYYEVQADAVTGDNPVGSITGNWKVTGSPSILESSITVTVGAGGDYATINAALEYLSTFYPLYKNTGVTATINLLTGFVMAEQILVSGLDLGWVTISGVDAETVITRSALITLFNLRYPAFGVEKGGASPVINQLFSMDTSGAAANTVGIYAYGGGSSATVTSGAGVKNSGREGITAFNSATIEAEGANVSGASLFGIVAYKNSRINADGANASGAGSVGITSDSASTINANGALIQNQTLGTFCAQVISGSHLEASGIDTTGSTVPTFSQAINTLTGSGIIYQ